MPEINSLYVYFVPDLLDTCGMEEIHLNPKELPFYLASRKHRFGGAILGFGIEIIILFLGASVIVLSTPSLRNGTGGNVSLVQFSILYLLIMLWSIFTWGSSRTPAHMILKMRVYSTDTGKPARWRHMALRCFLIPFTPVLIAQIMIQSGGRAFNNHALTVLGNFLLFSVTVVDALWILRGEKNQRLIDVFAHTVVVNECEANPIFSLENAGQEPELVSLENNEPLN